MLIASSQLFYLVGLTAYSKVIATETSSASNGIVKKENDWQRFLPLDFAVTPVKDSLVIEFFFLKGRLLTAELGELLLINSVADNKQMQVLMGFNRL